MGIKGIYKEIGTGKRISLTKLAVEHLEQRGRPLRIAIDISIWQFQVQAARGGSNPAIRTLFYRLLRLLSLSIQPIFVFDGPNKPVFKRHKRSGRGDGVATSMAKRLLRLFGFRIHDAPGEAEAECALLQLNGIVDAVLSEDVDTIMFGCTRTLRNWSAEGSKGSKTPTHVSMYDTQELSQGETGLDREGMVLVALMSGGDYIPEGIPGAGVKVACEAARAGFGKSLCRLKGSDTSGLEEWRENLIHELQTNESRFFRTKHKALIVPEDFPNLEVLRYYTHPVVSATSSLAKLETQSWNKPLDVLGLREFVRETFDWEYRGGAIKFIRVLAPSLLVRKIMDLDQLQDSQTRNNENIEEAHSRLVKAITNRRIHFSTDATPELRVSFAPTDIVGYNFEEEPEEEISYGRDGLALNSDDEFEALADEDEAEAVAKPRSRKPFNPTEPDLSWIPETVAKLGIPLMVEDWEEAQRAKASRKKLKASAKPKPKGKLGGMHIGALDRYVKVTKSLPATMVVEATSALEKPSSPVRSRSALDTFPAATKSQPSLPASSVSPKPRPSSRCTTRKQTKSTSSGDTLPPDPKTNPWTIAGSQPSPRGTKTKYASNNTFEAILISSSPPASPVPAARSRVRLGFAGAKAAPDKENMPPVTSPQNSRPNTPLGAGSEDPPRVSAVRDRSPTLCSSERPRRKWAMTELMPAGRGDSAAARQTGTRNSRGPLTRSRTVVAEAMSLESESEDDDGLPPLSSFAGRLLQVRSPAASAVSPPPALDPPPPVAPVFYKPATATNESSGTNPVPASNRSSVPKKPPSKQSKMEDVFGMRTTKLYVPRKSEPGYYREIEVTVEEAERLGRQNKGNHWRRSDVSFIDLTGEE